MPLKTKHREALASNMIVRQVEACGFTIPVYSSLTTQEMIWKLELANKVQAIQRTEDNAGENSTLHFLQHNIRDYMEAFVRLVQTRCPNDPLTFDEFVNERYDLDEIGKIASAVNQCLLQNDSAGEGAENTKATPKRTPRRKSS